MKSPYTEIKHRLSNVEEIGPCAFSATCPVQSHEERLFVSQEDSLILRCDAGCPTEAIVRAMGLSMEDLLVSPYRWASAIEPSRVEWTWKPRIPRGHVTDLSGDPGVGKSYLALALAAAISRGIVPGDEEATDVPRRTLLLTAEDDAGAVVRPRLEGMGS